jgi:hypothetical protein
LAEGVSELTPLMWIEAVDRVLIMPSGPIALSQIGCIAVSGQQHGLVSGCTGQSGALPAVNSGTISRRWKVSDSNGKTGRTDVMIAEVGNSQRTG